MCLRVRIAAGAFVKFASRRDSLSIFAGHRTLRIYIAAIAMAAGAQRCPAALALALVLTLRQCGAGAAETAAPQLA
jgi:hypothetical protein